MAHEPSSARAAAIACRHWACSGVDEAGACTVHAAALLLLWGGHRVSRPLRRRQPCGAVCAAPAARRGFRLAPVAPEQHLGVQRPGVAGWPPWVAGRRLEVRSRPAGALGARAAAARQGSGLAMVTAGGDARGRAWTWARAGRGRRGLLAALSGLCTLQTRHCCRATPLVACVHPAPAQPLGTACAALKPPHRLRISTPPDPPCHQLPCWCAHAAGSPAVCACALQATTASLRPLGVELDRHLTRALLSALPLPRITARMRRMRAAWRT